MVVIQINAATRKKNTGNTLAIPLLHRNHFQAHITYIGIPVQYISLRFLDFIYLTLCICYLVIRILHLLIKFTLLLLILQ